MATIEHRTPVGGSTTWTFKQVRVPLRPEGPSSAVRRAAQKLARRAAREPLTMTVRYRGGSECWWEVKARGRTHHFPGVWAWHDVMRTVLDLEDLW